MYELQYDSTCAAVLSLLSGSVPFVVVLIQIHVLQYAYPSSGDRVHDWITSRAIRDETR